MRLTKLSISIKSGVNSITQERIKEDAGTTIDLSNAYIARMIQNNGRMMQILEEQWHFLDPDDVGTFAQFQVDYVRYEEEVRSHTPIRTPDAIYEALGNIAFMRPEMNAMIKAKFNAKRDRLSTLTSPWWQRLWC